MENDTHQEGGDAPDDRPRRRKRDAGEYDEDRRERVRREDARIELAKGGLSVFNKQPVAVMMAAIVVYVAFQTWMNQKNQSSREASDVARYNTLVTELKEEREHDASEREKDRTHDASERERDREAGEKNFQRVVDHLKYLSDAVAKQHQQTQTFTLGTDEAQKFKDWLQSKRQAAASRSDEPPPPPTATGVN